MSDYEPAPKSSDKCPTCDSPAPHLHPAMQFEGEVQTCRDPYHAIRTAENARYQVAAGSSGVGEQG